MGQRYGGDCKNFVCHTKNFNCAEARRAGVLLVEYRGKIFK